MTLRSIITAVLTLISMPALIGWKYWEHWDFDYNAWLSPNFEYPLHIQWVVKFIGIHLRDNLLSYCLYRMTGKIYSLRVVMSINLAYSLIDSCLFVWSFNKGGDVLLVHSTLTFVVSLVIIWFDGTIKGIASKRKQKELGGMRNYPKNFTPYNFNQ